MTTTFTIVSANVRGLPIQRFRSVRWRIRQAIALSGASGVTFFQECDPHNIAKARFKQNRRSYARIVKDEAKRKGKEVYGSATETPIVLDSAVWQVVKGDVITVHGGLSHVSPTRHIVAVWAKHRTTGEKVLFLNCHPVSKGHYPAGRRGISSLSWRRSKLAQYFTRLGILARDARDDGYTVVYGGDLNDPTPRRVSPYQHALYNHGLDHLFAVPAADRELAKVTRISRPATKTMDHPLIGANIVLAAS